MILTFFSYSLSFYYYTLPRYTVTLFSHKLLIFIFGIWVNWQLRHTHFSVSLWRLLFHDWSKFCPAEFFPYANHFYGVKVPSSQEDPFVEAFHHHITYQDHHAEHYWPRFVYPSTPEIRRSMSSEARRAPNVSVVEMVVDWHAAEVSYAGSMPMRGKPWRWVRHINDNTGLHPVSDVVLHAILVYLGFGDDMGGVMEFERKFRVVVWDNSEEGVQTLSYLQHMFDCRGGDGFKEYSDVVFLKKTE